MENSMEVPQNVKHRATIWLSNSILRYITKGISNICPHKNLYTNVYSNIIHNNQKTKATKVSINLWMDKWSVVHPYNRILFSNINEWNTDTCYNTDEPWKHYPKWKKASHKRTHIVWLHLYEMSKTSKSCLRLGVEEKSAVMVNRYRISFGDAEMI